MIIPFTDRFKAKQVVIFAAAVFIVQQFEHTDTTFSLLTGILIVLSAIAYNAGGGLSHPAGAYILFNAIFTAIVALTYKVFLGEPGESNLRDPITTLLAYCAGMIVMGLAAALSRRLRPRHALLPNLEPENMRYAALGCLLVGVIVQYLTSNRISEAGSFASALHQLNYLPRMAIIFGAVYQINKSGGKSATNWIVWTAGTFMFIYGLIDFSKEGLFVAPFTWLMTAILYRFRFNWKHFVSVAVFALFAEVILVPFSQYGRRSRADSTTTTQAMAIQSAIDYLKDPFGTRALYLDEISNADIDSGPHIYTSEQPFMERLNMLAIDDAIIAYTDAGNVFGLDPTYNYYLNVVPHFLWKDKPFTGFGNTYAHELGILPPDDTTTGIAFSPVADAYHQARWFGVLAIFPVVIFLFFFITESLTGSVRDTPYALLPIALSSHAAPEGMLGGAIYLQTYGVALLVIVAYLSKYVLGRATKLAMGGDRVRVFRTRDFILGARRTQPVPQPGPSGSSRS